jgi:hypothetical protein
MPNPATTRKDFVMRTLVITTAVLVAFASAAHAGDNSCLGKIVIDGSQAKIVTNTVKIQGLPDVPPRVCGTFEVASKVGVQILKTCPGGSTCFVDQPLPRGGDVSRKTSLEIKKPTAIERVR